MTIWSMCIACCVSKDTNTPSEYVILTAFPLQQWLRERAWLLPYAYTACTATAGMGVHRWRTCAWASCWWQRFILFQRFFVFDAFVCILGERCCVCEPRPGTRRYYPPLVSHALLDVLTTLCSRLGCGSVFTWFIVPRQYSPVGVSKSARSLKAKVLWDTEIYWMCHEFQWLPWRYVVVLCVLPSSYVYLLYCVCVCIAVFLL